MTGKQALVILGVSALLGSAPSFVSWTAAAEMTKSVGARAIQVVDINTSDPVELEFVFIDLETKVAVRARFRDSPDGDDRRKLVQAFEDRSAIWAEMTIQRSDGKLWSLEILRALGPAD